MFIIYLKSLQPKKSIIQIVMLKVNIGQTKELEEGKPEIPTAVLYHDSRVGFLKHFHLKSLFS